jgi:hypothetical protein
MWDTPYGRSAPLQRTRFLKLCRKQKKMPCFMLRWMSFDLQMNAAPAFSDGQDDFSRSEKKWTTASPLEKNVSPTP